MIGDEDAFRDESIEASTMRELEDETGFRGTHAEILMSGPVAAGMTSEMILLVRLRGLQRVGAGGGVDGEDIPVNLVERKRVVKGKSVSVRVEHGDRRLHNKKNLKY